MERSKRFPGSGWSYPVLADQDGGVSVSRYEENVEQNILIIMGTAPGERQMRPEFGCRIHDLVFRPNNRMTCALAENFVRTAVSKWEPRVSDVEVAANPDRYEDNTMRIGITYTIQSTNATRNLVFPFYLEGQEEAE